MDGETVSPRRRAASESRSFRMYSVHFTYLSLVRIKMHS